MAELNGINTENMSAAIRAKIYSGILRTQLEPELQAMNYVDMITDFPDGESWEDLELGNGTVHDYAEGDAITYDGIDIGTRTFEINNYKYSGHYVTDKFVQDSYLSGQITSKIPAIQARALMADIEAKVWALQSKVQKEGFDANTVDGYHLRYAAGRVDGVEDAAGTITPEDVSYGITALDDLGYTGPKVMIVPTFQQHLIPKKCLSASLSHNKAWEGIVREGAMSGTKFAFNIMGVDVYTSSFLPLISETLKDHEGKETRVLTEAYPALLFANMPERRPFRMAWRKMPKFEGKWNMDFQREEFVTVCRYGLGVGDSKNLVVIGCSGPKTNIA